MRRMKGFTLVEIMIVVAIIGILIAIAVPGFLKARETSRRNSCQENQTKIDGAVQQYILEENLGTQDDFVSAIGSEIADWGAAAAGTGLVGEGSFIRFDPICPSSGAYFIDSSSIYCDFDPEGDGLNHPYPTGS